MVKEGKSITEIANERNIHSTTVYSHLAYLFDRKLICGIEQYVTAKEMRMIEASIKSVRATDKLKPLYYYLNEKIDY